jgi:hypothetical protein
MFREFLAPPDQPVSAWSWAGKVAVYTAFVIWGGAIIRTPLADAGELAMHCVNLPFHEAGHILLGFDGAFLQAIGGTLMQLLVPLVILVAFLVKNRDQFAASIMLWWLGQNFLDIAPYIADARAGAMPLLGGVTGQEAPGYHDWTNILGALGWLKSDQVIARLSFNFGCLLMLLAFPWGGAVLWAQGATLYRRRAGK